VQAVGHGFQCFFQLKIFHYFLFRVFRATETCELQLAECGIAWHTGITTLLAGLETCEYFHPPENKRGG
jgi:hypothetical protein